MDYSGNGWVTSEGFRQAMLKLGVDVTPEELITLQQRFAYQSNPGAADGAQTPSVRALTTAVGSMEKVMGSLFFFFFFSMSGRFILLNTLSTTPFHTPFDNPSTPLEPPLAHTPRQP